MATSAVPTIQNPLRLRSCSNNNNNSFLLLPLRSGKTHHLSLSPSRLSPRRTTIVAAKFVLSEILGGRGLCNGEQGLQNELKRKPVTSPADPDSSPPPAAVAEAPFSSSTLDDAFEKELLGLTGGFPGGEKGLQLFIQNYPPPPKKSKEEEAEEDRIVLSGSWRPKPPELPLLMPGMIVIVKNPSSPYHMYCGIVQRVTDGKAGVLFEGGNWDRLITFNLGELERRDKGPPMVNPKSAVLEAIVDKAA